MLHINNSFLRSKFARRIFTLFILSAALPVTVIAFLSYTHISTQLNKQGYEQSRIVCKAIGMALYRRLTIAHDELAAIGKSLNVALKATNNFSIKPKQDIAADLEAVTLFTNNGKKFYLRGKLEQRPVINGEQKRQLANGKTVIQALNVRENHLDILLIQAPNKRDTASDLLVGKVDSTFIWAVNDLLPPANDLLVLNPDGMILHSSRPSLRLMLPQLKRLLAASISGHLEWSLDGELNHASYWSVFIKDLFSASNLIVVVSQPESTALLPLENFRIIYVPLLLLAIFCVSFVAAKQIRKKLAPLVTLQDATRRIANGDFGGRISINTDDEFAALGDAFNAMAGRLETQFTSLATMAEVDRLILSSFDAQFIITTALERASELTPCNLVALLELSEHEASSGKLSIRHAAGKGGIHERHVQLSHDEFRQLLNNPSHLRCNSGSSCPSYLKRCIGDNTRILLLLPTFIKQRLSNVLIFGFSDGVMEKEEDWSLLRKFADHVAVALANAGWEERIYHQAHYDALTNLPNRALLKDRLGQAIARAQRNNSHVGVMFIDLDRFKLVNDSLGHAEGDIVLKKTADILIAQLRRVDTVARFGGDEFVIIIPDIDGKSDAVFELGTITDKIFKAAQKEFEVDRQTVHTKMSIGIALYPKDGIDPEELIKNADAAMYHAKGKGRARHEFFAPELNVVASYRLQLEQDLRRALTSNELLLNYQPKVDTSSGSLFGAEALIRWCHPERGMISPSEFIGIAEETGLIRDLGEWVIREVCRQIMAWRTTGLGAVPIAVNVSPHQFQEYNFIATLTSILEKNQLEPGILELEITETAVMAEAEESIAKLKQCREMGLHISMDDFGTGYSSLSYLRKLPIHTLKIDQSFVAAIDDDDDTRAIVAAIIILAHKLGLMVVAEGVEKQEQRRLLQDMRCDAIQGYLISKPLSADQFAARYLQPDSGAGSADCHTNADIRNAAN